MVKKFERRLGLGSVIAISMGSMLGSGIFVLPGVAYSLTGPSLFIAYLLAAICILPAAVSKSELATAMPTSGGTYVYLERTFGPLAGTISGLGLYLSLLLKSAFALVGFGAYLSVLTQHLDLKTMSLGMLLLITVLNIFGVGKASSFVSIIVVISVTTLAGLSAFTFIGIDNISLQPSLSHGPEGLFAATAMVFVAFAGVTKIAAIAEEIKNPGRNVPRGILFSLIIITCLYCFITYVMASALPGPIFDGNLKPVHSLAELVGGTKVGKIAAVISILTMVSMANAGILAASRFPFAMSRDLLLPSAFGRISSRFLTPVWSILISATIVALAILFLDVVKIAKLASCFMIIMFIFVNISVIVLRETRVQWYQPTYKSFAYPLLQLFGIISGFFLLYSIGYIVPTAIMAICIPGVVLFIFFSRKRVDRIGVLGLRLPRKSLVEENNYSSRHIEEISFSEEANVIVAIFGNERSPEVLAEMGLALADGNKLEVIHLTEVPDQTDLDDIIEESFATQAIERRVRHMGQIHNIRLQFDSVVSHDILKTISDVSLRLHSHWLVVEWGGKTRGAFTLHNPIGWIRDHLSCNLMTFRDKGVRYFKKILVVASTNKSNELLLDTADHLAHVHEAEITLCTYVADNSNTETMGWQKELLDNMCARSKFANSSLIVTGKKEWEAYAKVTSEFDLVIFEDEKITNFYQVLFGSTYDKLMEHSACSVISVKPRTGAIGRTGFQKIISRTVNWRR